MDTFSAHIELKALLVLCICTVLNHCFDVLDAEVKRD